MSGWQRIKSALATPMMRRLLRRPNLFVVREQLAAKYLRGEGIEVGACNAPLPLPPGARARYVDRAPADVLHANDHRDVDVKEPDLIADVETLVGIDDGSLDFVVANHVLEHVENPLRAMVAISRVLRRGGVAFIALPDKRWTFDKARPITPLWHVERDFREGPEWSRRGHYLDYVAHVDGARDVEAVAADYERRAQNIHFHVWDFPAMQGMFNYVSSVPQIGLAVEYCQQNRNEAVFIMRKP